jgi:uncharacterized membrane protein
MTHERLHALTDGIFAIVMTLMVFQLKIPELIHADNGQVWMALKDQTAVLLGYFISFFLLFTYWRAHNFTITIMAKNIDINLLNLNSTFLFLVGMIPFTTQLAGKYANTSLALSIYALNIILIGLNLAFMRLYIEKSAAIESLERNQEQRQNAFIRILTPVVLAAISIPLSFINIKLAFIVLIIAALFNLLNNAADFARKYFINPFAKIFQSK